MNEELKIIIRAVTTDARKNIEAVKGELREVSQEAQATSSKIGAAMKGVAGAVGVAVTAITAAVTAIVAFGKSTLEVQKQIGQLNAAFAAAGKTAHEAATVYNGLFRFLGESDTAIEASNLLIKLTQDEQNLTEWTKILKGVYATFPDSLPIEGLVESANETARVGQVTGSLADALNWAGESEDAFNEKLARTTSLSEREALIRSTLNNLYGTAAAIYENNNKALLDYNESQARLQTKTAELGATITPLLTYLNNLGTTIITYIKPAFELVIPYIAGFVLWLTEAISRAAIFTGVMSSSSESIAQVGDRTSKALGTAKASTQGVVSGLNQVKKAAEEAKRAALGFDELNIVPSGKSSAGASAGGVSPDTGLNAGLGSLDLSDSLQSLENFKGQVEQIKNDIDAWMEEWGWTLKTIGAILATLSVRGLIVQFGKLIGLGDEFAKALSFKGLATGFTKLTGWLGAVIGLLKEGNSFWSVMGAAFPKLAGMLSKVGSAIAGVAKGVAGVVGGLSGGWIALIIAAIVVLTSAIYFLWENWDAVVQKVKEFCNSNLVPILNEFKSSFAALWGAIQELGAAFANLGVSIYNALPDWLQDWLYNICEGVKQVVAAIWEWVKSVDWLEVIGTAIEWLGGFITAILGGTIGGAIQSVLNLVESAVQIITGVVQIISGIVSGLINGIVGLFTGDFSKALDSVELIWEGIKNVFKGAVDAVLGTVWGFIEGIINWFKHMWDVLVGHSIVPDTIEAIIKWFLELPKRAVKIVADFAGEVIGWFGNLFSKAYSATLNAFKGAKNGFANVWSNIKAGFGNVADWFKNTFTKAWTAVKNVFSTGGKIFDGIKDGILNGLKAVINGLINGINNVIAVPFNGINKALKKIKDVNIMGAKPFDWMPTISVPQIPKLARGGIIDQATLAMIGERGREAVVPLENNTEWMDKLVDKLTARTNTPSKIVLMLDSKELGWANINSINNITRQTGALQLVLA